MKNHVLKSIFGLALIAFVFSGCDLFEKADDVSFDIELPLEFVIDDEGVSNTPKAYTQTLLLKATDNADVAKYKDKIKDVKINKVRYKITECEPTGTVTFSNGEVFLAATSKTIASQNTKVLANEGPLELPNYDADGFTKLAEMIKADKQAQIGVKGTFSTTPIFFKLTVYFDATITANALD